MRLDEKGNECPETLGEYRELCLSIGGPDNPAVEWLDSEISVHENGQDEKVIVPDSQMKAVLMPRLVMGLKRLCPMIPIRRAIAGQRGELLDRHSEHMPAPWGVQGRYRCAEPPTPRHFAQYFPEKVASEHHIPREPGLQTGLAHARRASSILRNFSHLRCCR